MAPLQWVSITKASSRNTGFDAIYNFIEQKTPRQEITIEGGSYISNVKDHSGKNGTIYLNAVVNVYDYMMEFYLAISRSSQVKFCFSEAILLVINESIRGVRVCDLKLIYAVE